MLESGNMSVMVSFCTKSKTFIGLLIGQKTTHNLLHQREKERERERQRETERQRQTETDRESNKETEEKHKTRDKREI